MFSQMKHASAIAIATALKADKGDGAKLLAAENLNT